MSLPPDIRDAPAALHARRRLFIAWRPDPVEDARIDALIEVLRVRLPDPAYRWSRAEHRHCTLRFLGDTAPAQADAIAAGLHGLASAHSPIAAWVAGWQYWPSVAAPRVFVARIESGGALERMAREIDEIVAGAGIARDPHHFRAHLTLARTGRLRATARAFVEPPPRIDLEVDHLALVASELLPEGPRHATVGRWPLTGQAGAS